MPFSNILKEQHQSVLEKYLSEVSFPINSCILREGDPGDGCYFITQGTVRLELEDTETDTDAVLGFLEAGSFLGEFSLIDGKPRSATAYAHTDVKARWFSTESYESICKDHPEIGILIANSLSGNLTEKLRDVMQRISGYIFSNEIDHDTNQMVANAVQAQQLFAGWSEDRIDALLKDTAETIDKNASQLAEVNVKETGIGNVNDKIKKIHFACSEVYKTLAGKVAAGVLDTDPKIQVTKIGHSIGVVLGIIPVTNPISTIVFKTLITLKGRNAVIFSCHKDALGVGMQANELINSILEKHGAPKYLVQTIYQRSSRKKTMMFMHHPDVAFILATGGSSMVKAAYSSGKPAIGVGPGNAPVLICSDADLSQAAEFIIRSKSFDNGVICGSENNLVVVSSVYQKFLEALEAHGAVILTADEKSRFTPKFFDLEAKSVNKLLIGKSAQFIAQKTELNRGSNAKLIIVPIKQNELKGLYAHEKLCPVLSVCMVQDENEGLQICKQILTSQGRGHTAVIYTNNQEMIQRFGSEIEASRILVKASSAQGCVGLGTGLLPSFTLGCGTFGGNSTTDNVGYQHLINIKRLAVGL